MVNKENFAERIWRRRWPAIAIAVVLILAVIQVIRVNQFEKEVDQPVPTIKYTGKGPLLTGSLSIEASTFHATRIDLNRQAKLAGKFNTPSTKQSLMVLVLDEENFENWKAQREYRAVATTGVVPGGRINPVVGPGTFFLVIDNRASDKDQLVETNFTLD